MQGYQFVFGLDFGTSKTAMSLARCGTPNTVADDLRLGDGQTPRTTTCILLRNADDEAVAIGTEAEREFLLAMTPPERAAHRLAANFKPQIHHSERDRRYAEIFLKRLCEIETLAAKFADYRETATVVVGRPASWPIDAEEILLDILREAGFPNPVALPESAGAFFFHLGARLKAEDLAKDVLVIDWGAGTCSFSLMHQGKPVPHKCWGSDVFGGRLFDDLFYTWILDHVREHGGQRAGALAAMQHDETAHRVLQVLRAREVKEEFSLWSRQPKRRFRSSAIELGDHFLGMLEVDSVADFEGRARSYCASATIRSELRALQSSAGPTDRKILDCLLAGQPIDLLAWGEELLRCGAGSCGAGEADIVILTGGSTAWPWFQSLVRSSGVFRPSASVQLDDISPDLTIARGLGRSYALGAYALEVARLLDDKKTELLAAVRDTFLIPHITELSEQIARQYIRDCQTTDVEPILADISARKISQTEAEERLKHSIGTWYEHSGKDCVHEAIEQMSAAAGREIQAIARQHGIEFGELLALAVELYGPLGALESCLPGATIADEIVKEFHTSLAKQILTAVAAIVYLLFYWEAAVVGVAVAAGVAGSIALYRHFFESEEHRRAREKEEQEAAQAARRAALTEQEEKVREKFRQAVREALTGSPLLARWSSPDGPLYSNLRSTLLEVARSSGIAVE